MAALDSVGIPIQISADSGTTWKTMICLTEWSLEGTVETTETETFCGKVTGLGTPSYTISTSAVADFAPSVSQVSLEDVQGWFLAKTSLKFKAEYPAGTGADYYRAGDVRFSGVTETLAVGESVAFDVSMVVTNLDLVP